VRKAPTMFKIICILLMFFSVQVFAMSERDALAELRTRDAYVGLIAAKTPQGLVATSGAVGANRTSYRDVGEQRHALWAFRRDLIQGAQGSADAAKAWAYAWGHLTYDGYFENGLALPDTATLEANTFYLSAYCEATNPVPYVQGPVHVNLAYLSQNLADIYAQGARATNRLAFAATAFILAGERTGNVQAVRSGKLLLEQAFLLQSADGYFSEKGGWDTSYQAVTMLQLEALYFGSADPAVRNAVAIRLQRAALWLEARVHATGVVCDRGNTRTANNADDSPEHKQINYPEVALALGYAGAVLSDESLIDAGASVADYFLHSLP